MASRTARGRRAPDLSRTRGVPSSAVVLAPPLRWRAERGDAVSYIDPEEPHDVSCCDCFDCDNARRAAASHYDETTNQSTRHETMTDLKPRKTDGRRTHQARMPR